MSNLYEYDLSLLAVSRDVISRFELCQFDEMFNVFYRYDIKFNKTFCLDFSACFYACGKIAQKVNMRTKSTREQCRQISRFMSGFVHQ